MILIVVAAVNKSAYSAHNAARDAYSKTKFLSSPKTVQDGAILTKCDVISWDSLVGGDCCGDCCGDSQRNGVCISEHQLQTR